MARTNRCKGGSSRKRNEPGAQPNALSILTAATCWVNVDNPVGLAPRIPIAQLGLAAGHRDLLPGNAHGGLGRRSDTRVG